MGAKTEYNQFQLFVLAFLMAQEQQQEENGQAFGGPNPNNLPLSHRYITTVSDGSLLEGLGYGSWVNKNYVWC